MFKLLRTGQWPGFAVAHRRAPIWVLAGLLALLSSVLLPPRAGAEVPSRTMRLNLLQSTRWPAVTINFNLRSLDNTPIGKLEPGQFLVQENGLAQSIRQVALGREVGTPLSVVLVLDTSGSMAGDKLKAAQTAAAAFMQALDPADQVALLPFNSKVQAATGFTTDRAGIATVLNQQTANGNTALYDALWQAVRLSATVPADRRRAVVLLTDGQDTSSTNAPLVAVEAAKQAGTLVYTIGVGGDTDDGVLRSLSEPTGGRFSKAAGPADLQQIYVELAQELAGQYLLTYTSTTHVSKAYQIIHVHVVYQAPAGDLIMQDINYWPPSAAIVPETPVAPTATVNRAVPVPAGLLPAAARPTLTPYAGPLPDPNRQAVQLLGTFAGILAGLAVLLALGGIVLLQAPTPVGARMARYVAAGAAEVGGAVPTSFSGRVLYPTLEAWGRRLQALTPGGYLDRIGQLLLQLGPPFRLRRMGFLGVQAGAAAAGLLIGAGLGALIVAHDPLRWALLAAVGLLIGLYMPYYLLVRRVTLRKRLLLRAMPAALDFLAIMAEAGTGFDSALTELVRRWRNTLTDEFALLLIDFQIGKPRREAWRDLMARTQVSDLNNFAVAIMQSEQSGSSVSGLLRVQAEQIRIRRRQRAEEEARTAPVKMLIPLALFIFPCIMIVILGPALPQLFGTLTRLGR